MSRRKVPPRKPQRTVPSVPSKRVPLALMIAVGIILLGIVAAAAIVVVRRVTAPSDSPTEPPATPGSASGSWLAVLMPKKDGSTQRYWVPSPVEGIGLMVTASSASADAYISLTGVDLDQQTMLWQHSISSKPFVTTDGIVVESANVASDGTTTRVVQVLDPATGAVKTQSNLDDGQDVINVAGGIVLLGSSGTVCARDLSLGPCLWQQTVSLPSSDDFLASTGGFSDGSWLTTGSGVIDRSTGEPAPFGSDATSQDQNSTYYMGPTRDRVFKVTGTGDGATVQQWNPTTDAALGPELKQSAVVFDAGSPDYVAVQGGSIVAYSWDTGQQDFTVDVPLDAPTAGPVAGAGDLLLGGSLWVDGSEQAAPNLVVVNMQTGQIAWQQSGWSTVGSTVADSGTTAYAFDSGAGTYRGFDANTLQQTITFAPPEATSVVGISGNRVVAADTSGSLWVLDHH